LKIAYATDNYWPRTSGLAVSVDTFKRELEHLGDEVHVLAPDYGANGDAGRTNVHRVKAFSLPFSKEDRLAYPTQRSRVYRLLDRLNPDLVHVQTEFTVAWAAWSWARSRGVPVAVTSHTFWEQYIRNYLPAFTPRFAQWLVTTSMRRFCAQGEVVIAPTQRMAEVVAGYGATQPIVIIPTGFEHRQFSGIDRAGERASSFLLERHPSLRGKQILLTVGRLGKEKNHDFLLDVFSNLALRLPEAMWLVVGDGPYRGELEERIRERGLSDRVVITGYLPREKVKHAFALGDIFIFGSKTETQGLVTVEAMACGTPVVAVGEMGTLDVMRGDNGGFMVREHVGDFASRVHALATDQALHRSKSEEAIRYAKRWSASGFAAQLRDVYVSLLRRENMAEKSRRAA